MEQVFVNGKAAMRDGKPTDVLAGWAVGGLSGWYAHSRDVPIMIELLPHGFAVGFKRQF